MKQRYISLMLSVVVLFLSAGILFVHGQQETYSGPDASFPNGLKSKPVDTSNSGQEKPGDLNLKTLRFGLNTDSNATNVALSGKISHAINGSFIDLNDLSLGVNIQNSTGPISLSAFGPLALYTKGLRLPIEGGAQSPAGTIYYNSSEKKVKLCDKTNCSAAGDWTDIGTGTSTGSGEWKKEDGGIYYDGGNVRVTGGSAGYYFVTDKVVIAENKSFSLIKKVLGITQPACPPEAIDCGTGGGGGGGGGFDYGVKLSCDDDSNTIDCGDFVADTGVEGARGYDEFKDGGVVKRRIYTYKTNPPSTVVAGKFIGKLKVLGFDLSGTKSETINDIAEGRCKSLPSNSHGLVVSFVVQTGGGENEATEFYVADSFSGTGTFTFFKRNKDAMVGNGPIVVCTRPDLPFEDMKNYIEKITVNYIPFD